MPSAGGGIGRGLCEGGLVRGGTRVLVTRGSGEVAGEMRQGRDRCDCPVRILEHDEARIGHFGAEIGRRTGDDRHDAVGMVFRHLAQHGFEHVGDRGRLAHVGHEDEEDRHVGAGGNDVDHLAVEADIVGDLRGRVDRIAGAGERQQRPDLFGSGCVERRQSDVRLGAGVGHHDADTARRGDDDRVFTGRQLSRTGRERDVDCLLDGVGRPGAVCGEHRIEHLLRSGERPGVRLDGGQPLLAGTGLDGDDRLARKPCCLQRALQALAVAAAFHVGDDDAGVGVARQPFDAVGDVHVGLVAGGDEVAEADTGLRRERHDVGADRAALAGDADRALARPDVVERGRERGVETGVKVDEAVGAEQPRAGGAARSGDALLCLAPGLVDLAEAGAEEYDRAHPRLKAFLDGAFRELGSDRHDGEVRHLIEVGNALRGLQSEDLGPVRVDWHDGALEMLLHQRNRLAADLHRVRGGPDHGDAARAHHGVETRRPTRGCVHFRTPDSSSISASEKPASESISAECSPSPG